MPATRNQAVSSQVFDLIDEISKTPDQAIYGVYAVGLASMLRMNGLQQTLDYLEHGIQDPPRKAVATVLRGHLLRVLDLQNIDTLSGSAYALASRRALRAAQYFKRFAESSLQAQRNGSGART